MKSLKLAAAVALSVLMGWSGLAESMTCFRTGFGYQELEWIGVGTTTGPYFDTGYVPHSQDKVEAKVLFTVTPVTGDTLPLCDARSSAASFGILSEKGKLRLDINANHQLYLGEEGFLTPDSVREIVVDRSKGKASVTPGVDELSVTKGNDVSLEKTLVVFALRNSSGTSVKFLAKNMRLYSFRVTDNKGLVKLDLVPCRKVKTQAIGLYDRASGRFMENAGKGELLCGSPIAAQRLQPLEYVEVGADGGTRVNTYFIPQNTDRVVARVSYTKINDLCPLFDARSDGNNFAFLSQDNCFRMDVNGNGNEGWTPVTTPVSSNVEYGIDANYATGSAVITPDLAIDMSGGDGRMLEMPLTLFSLYLRGSAAVKSYAKDCRLMSFEVWDAEGRKKLDLVPCRNTTLGEIGLYDRVREIFLSPSGNPLVAGHELGAGQKLEWIGVGSDADVYFDTGYVPHSQDKIETKVLFTTTPGTSDIWPICDARSAVSSFGIIAQKALLRLDSGADAHDWLGEEGFLTPDSVREIVVDRFKGKASVTPGVSETTVRKGDGSILEKTLAILALRNAEGTKVSYRAKNMRLYSFKVTDKDGKVKLDLIPFQKPGTNGEVGLYDLVGGRFLSKIGSGDLASGPVIEAPGVISMSIKNDGTEADFTFAPSENARKLYLAYGSKAADGRHGWDHVVELANVAAGATKAFGVQIPAGFGSDYVAVRSYLGDLSASDIACSIDGPSVKKAVKVGSAVVRLDLRIPPKAVDRMLYVAWGEDEGVSLTDWTNKAELGVVEANAVECSINVPNEVGLAMRQSRGYRVFLVQNSYDLASDYQTWRGLVIVVR